MIESIVTAKGQTTVPLPIRKALELRPGDRISYILKDNRVTLVRSAAEPRDDDPFVLFAEWSDDLDSAYDAL